MAVEPKSLRWSRAELWALLAILSTAIVIRLAFTPHSLWFDEIASLKLSEQPLDTLWSNWIRRETNPPLYYSLLREWRALFGSSDLVLRGLSTAIGGAGVVFGYLLARMLAGRIAALWAATLIALSPSHILFSQEVRAYALTHTATLAALLGVTMFLREEETPSGRRWATLLYTVAMIVALYAHTMMALLPLLVNVYVLAWFVFHDRGRRRMLIEWLAANAIVALAWAWWVDITVWQMGHVSNVAWMARPTVSLAARYVLDTYIPGAVAPVRFVVLVTMVLLLVRATWSGRKEPILLLALCALVGPSLLYGASFITSVMLPRTLFWASGPFLVCAAIGLGSLRPRFALPIGSGLVLALVFGAYLSTRTSTKEPWRAVVQTVQAVDPSGWVAAGDPGVAFALQHYCLPASCRLRLFTVPGKAETWSAGMPRPNERTLATLDAMTRRHALFFATRLGRGDPAAVPNADIARHARARDFSQQAGLPESMRLVEWQPAAPAPEASVAR